MLDQESAGIVVHQYLIDNQLASKYRSSNEKYFGLKFDQLVDNVIDDIDQPDDGRGIRLSDLHKRLDADRDRYYSRCDSLWEFSSYVRAREAVESVLDKFPRYRNCIAASRDGQLVILEDVKFLKEDVLRALVCFFEQKVEELESNQDER